MKKLIALTLSAIMALSVVGCSSGGKEEDNKVKIGILQQLEHVALDNAREGFVKALEDNGYVDGENLVLDIQNAQSDQSNLSTMSDRLVNEKNDIILAIATGAAQSVAGKTKDIPILITAVTDPVDAGLAESMEKPNTNVSGTSDASPIKEQIELMLRLKPDTKVVGLMYTSSEDNSVLQINQVKAILDDMNLEYVEQTVTNSNDVQQAAQSIVKKCDAIYIPTDNVLASSMAIVGSEAVREKVPVICGESGMVMSGGLATLGIDYYNLGYQTGEMAIRVLNGEDITTMQIETQKDYSYTINGDMADALGITIPAELQQYVVHAE
ncbi:MAG: ABC transporter substrate-binding protein [Oscillospiraceae bacterium]|nr:ABC transporter substrate-binding protein [Oscillospiraceae bacterium]